MTATVASRKLHLTVIPGEMVAKFLEKAPQTVDLLARACAFSGGRFEPESTLIACAGGAPGWVPQLWVIGYSGGGELPTVEAVAVTQIAVYPTGLHALEVILVGGKGAREWAQFVPEFKVWAKKNDCALVQMYGRKGWARTLSDDWREVSQVFECRIDDLRGLSALEQVAAGKRPSRVNGRAADDVG